MRLMASLFAVLRDVWAIISTNEGPVMVLDVPTIMCLENRENIFSR